jgi:hypothetical protein
MDDDALGGEQTHGRIAPGNDRHPPSDGQLVGALRKVRVWVCATGAVQVPWFGFLSKGVAPDVQMQAAKISVDKKGEFELLQTQFQKIHFLSDVGAKCHPSAHDI